MFLRPSRDVDGPDDITAMTNEEQKKEWGRVFVAPKLKKQTVWIDKESGHIVDGPARPGRTPKVVEKADE